MTDDVSEVLVLDVSGDYGHFRKNYTTSSPLTHGIPPRTALTGLLGAIMGYPPTGTENYHTVFAPTQARIAVEPLTPIQKQRLNKNMLKVKGETARLISIADPPESITRNQVPFEVLRQPSYRLYVWHGDTDRMTALEDQFVAHKAVYTPSLGLSELIAEFEFQGRYEARKTSGGPVDSAVNSEHYNVTFEQGKHYQRENISLVMDQERVVQSFADIIYAQHREQESDEPTATPPSVTVQDGTVFEVSDLGSRVTFLAG